ncbi:MAG: PQQ-binding-like beta-propeller repeat protein [Spirochaetota bacterium]
MAVIKSLKSLVASLVVLPLIVSCGLAEDGTDIPAVGRDEQEIMETQEVSSLTGLAQPGIHESSGFFPVEPEDTPLRFIVVGDMGGPVLYSSSTLPAWLSGKNAFMLGSDGRLATVALAESSNLHLPPDLAAYASYYSSLDPRNEEPLDREPGIGQSQSGQVMTGVNLPLSVCVTGPTSAVFILNDYRLLGITDGTLTVLRQFETEISGMVFLSGSPREIVIADSYSKILAIDGQNGNNMWVSAGGPVLFSGGMAIYIGPDSYLQIHEALDGSMLASSDLAGFSASIRPGRDASSIFAVLGDGRLVAMDNAGRTIWIAETGIQPLWILNDLKQVHVASHDMLVAFDKTSGSELWHLSLPVPPAGDPVILPGSIIYAGTDGKVYASVPDPEPAVPTAADPGERVAAVIGFRLEKYVRNHTPQLVTFMPYVDGAVHEGPSAFTVLAYGPVEIGGEYWLTWDGEDRDVVLALFNERGDELRSNLDEFGAHDTFSYHLDKGGLYFIALGRQDPLSLNEPVFLSVIPARRN